jgi:hypothetical protein
MRTSVPRRRRIVTVATAILGLAVALPLALSGPASAATTARHRPAHHATHHQTVHHKSLSGTTSVTTAPGIAKTLLGAGIVPLPVLPRTRFGVAKFAPLEVRYGFPITGGNPDLTGPSGDINHAGGISFVSRKAHLEIGKFDIDLAAGKIFATEVNHASARIAVLDLDLSGLKVATKGGCTTLSGISLKLDPAAAGALNATFGIALPTDGSLVFGSAVVQLH